MRQDDSTGRPDGIGEHTYRARPVEHGAGRNHEGWTETHEVEVLICWTPSRTRPPFQHRGLRRVATCHNDGVWCVIGVPESDLPLVPALFETQRGFAEGNDEVGSVWSRRCRGGIRTRREPRNRKHDSRDNVHSLAREQAAEPRVCDGYVTHRARQGQQPVMLRSWRSPPGARWRVSSPCASEKSLGGIGHDRMLGIIARAHDRGTLTVMFLNSTRCSSPWSMIGPGALSSPSMALPVVPGMI